MDFVQMLANATNNLSAITTQLVLAIAGVGGIALIILYLSGQAGRPDAPGSADGLRGYLSGCSAADLLHYQPRKRRECRFKPVCTRGRHLRCHLLRSRSPLWPGRRGGECRSDGPAVDWVDICAQRTVTPAPLPERWPHRLNTRG